MTIDWNLVASYALGSVIATTIGALVTAVGAVLLRRWLRDSPVLAGLAQLPQALAAARPATAAEVEAVRSAAVAGEIEVPPAAADQSTDGK